MAKIKLPYKSLLQNKRNTTYWRKTFSCRFSSFWAKFWTKTSWKTKKGLQNHPLYPTMLWRQWYCWWKKSNTSRATVRPIKTAEICWEPNFTRYKRATSNETSLSFDSILWTERSSQKTAVFRSSYGSRDLSDSQCTEKHKC